MDPAALEAAREVGRRAADDARDKDEYEFLMWVMGGGKGASFGGCEA
jgi:hypothetical protein